MPVILLWISDELEFANARVTGRIVQITAHDAREVESILALLLAAGCEPEDLEIGRADLEDVFLRVMERH